MLTPLILFRGFLSIIKSNDGYPFNILSIPIANASDVPILFIGALLLPIILSIPVILMIIAVKIFIGEYGI